ncbi:MAG: FtsH protease activity modulator HflK [Bacteroidales bacterium]
MKKFFLKLLVFLGFEIQENGDQFRIRGFFPLPFNWLILMTALILFFGIVSKSWFTLDKTEKGAVEYFGEFSYEVGPGGFYFKAPFVSKVNKVATEIRYRHELGFRTINEGDSTRYSEVPEEAVMLTKGGHLGSVYWIIQYTILDCYNWLYQVAEPAQVLDKLSQGSMRLIIGQTRLDDVLTTEKLSIQEKNKKLLQSYCDLIGLKVKIDEVKLQDCTLPDPNVQKAYDGVMNAIKTKEKMQNDATGYANKVVPEAQGKANIILNAARSYYSEQVYGAKGEIARFMGLYEQYRKDPATTRQKLWYEAWQETMPDVKKTIVNEKALLNLKNF